MTVSKKDTITNTVEQKEHIMEQVALITEDNQTIVVEHFENGNEIATQDFVALLEDDD